MLNKFVEWMQICWQSKVKVQGSNHSSTISSTLTSSLHFTFPHLLSRGQTTTSIFYGIKGHSSQEARFKYKMEAGFISQSLILVLNQHSPEPSCQSVRMCGWWTRRASDSFWFARAFLVLALSQSWTSIYTRGRWHCSRRAEEAHLPVGFAEEWKQIPSARAPSQTPWKFKAQALESENLHSNPSFASVLRFPHL